MIYHSSHFLAFFCMLKRVFFLQYFTNFGESGSKSYLLIMNTSSDSVSIPSTRPFVTHIYQQLSELPLQPPPLASQKLLKILLYPRKLTFVDGIQQVITGNRAPPAHPTNNSHTHYHEQHHDPLCIHLTTWSPLFPLTPTMYLQPTQFPPIISFISLREHLHLRMERKIWQNADIK